MPKTQQYIGEQFTKRATSAGRIHLTIPFLNDKGFVKTSLFELVIYILLEQNLQRKFNI